MDLKRQLAEAFEREQSAQQKAYKAFEQLREAQAELQELGVKQDRTEKRQKRWGLEIKFIKILCMQYRRGIGQFARTVGQNSAAKGTN